ncbi:unnamed protein product [Effrenium voratum]|nr:unnamed protein product [Effrenium voratum]
MAERVAEKSLGGAGRVHLRERSHTCACRFALAYSCCQVQAMSWARVLQPQPVPHLQGRTLRASWQLAKAPQRAQRRSAWPVSAVTTTLVLCQRVQRGCTRQEPARRLAALARNEERAARSYLQKAGLDSEDAEVSVRCFLSALKHQDPADREGTLKQWLERRAQREPVQYILGSWPFYPLPEELLVRAPVLIPRPETEELVDRIIKANKPRRIVDFGCGSGAIIVSLLHAFPAAQGVAVDPSTAAIALTKENAIRCGVRDRLAAYQCTAKDFAKTSKEDSFDLIVSNPPYIPSHEISTLQQEVKDFEDHGALDGGSDGLDIVAEILRAASAIGAPGARIYLEVHHTHPAVFEAPDSASTDLGIAMQGLELIRTVRDVYGQPRFIELVLPGSQEQEPDKMESCFCSALLVHIKHFQPMPTALIDLSTGNAFTSCRWSSAQLVAKLFAA